MNPHTRLRALIGSDGPAAAVRRWTVDYLTDVLAGRDTVTAVRHPLGFLCFPAWRGNGLGVCVHVWTDGQAANPTTSPLHAHSWDLLSVVLYGTVGNDVIDVEDAPARPTHRVFEIDSAADGDLVRATSRLVTYRTRSTERFRAGEVYTLPHGVFHLSDVRGEAVTVVLGEDRHGKPDLSLGALADDDHWVRRIGCTATQTRHVAQVVRAHLQDTALPDQLEDRCERAT